MTLKLPGTVALIAVVCVLLAACGGGHAARQRLTPNPSQLQRGGGAQRNGLVSTGVPVYSFGDVGSGYKLRLLEHDMPTQIAGIHGDVIQVATSNSDGYALTRSGTVWAWGAGRRGELGIGHHLRFSINAVRVRFPAGVKIVSLPNPMPYDGALAIDSRGRAWGWGLNAADDLCLAKRVALLPMEIPLSDVTLATGARYHSVFDSQGRVYACGSGSAGALGDGSTLDSFDPTPVVGLPAGVQITTLTSSWEGSGALLSDGTYYNWGYNAGGQLGDGTTADSAVPVRVELPGAVRQVFQGGSRAGNGQTLAILTNGSVWGWGDGTWGQLGDGTRADSAVPVRVEVPSGVSFEQVNSGGYASYAIDDLGRLWVWGANNLGQLGTGSPRLVQREPVDAGLHLTQISSTSTNVVALGH